jgi:adenine-specific DNA-methyltransferase
MLKRHSSHIIANDFEKYASIISKTYLTNKSEVDLFKIESLVENMNNIVDSGKGPTGFIQKLYAPKDDRNILKDERVFFSKDNARRLDAYAQLIMEQDETIRHFLQAPLLSAASIHANTGGVFKGFYKDSNTGIGKFGGSGQDALKRILAPIRLTAPIFSNFESTSSIFNIDAAELPKVMEAVDIAYLDPPYNQHPYGSNYFMLNLIIDYKEPENISRVSGIPEDWKRSAYNKKKESLAALKKLVEEIPTRYLILSFSDDGFLDPEELHGLFNSIGKSTTYDIEYNTYRAARNLEGRSKKITEHLFLCEKA